jgi:hypothetical protein
MMVKVEELQRRLQEAIDHAHYKINEAQELLRKPDLSVEEVLSVSRVLDQLAAIDSTGGPASYGCVG